MALPALSPNAWLRYDLIRRHLVRLSRSGELRTVLEVGMGQGAVAVRLAERLDYTGVELDTVSLGIARERLAVGGRGVALGGMLDDVLDPGARFDLVCAFEVLEHIEDDAAALHEWVARVRPGGYVLLSVPAFAERFAAADEMAGHFRRYSPDGLAGRLTGAGLTDVDIQVYGGPLGLVLEAGRNAYARRQKRVHGTDWHGATVAERTAGSGRVLQPPAALGVLTQAGTAPFRLLNRSLPGRGTGLVALARKPR